MTNAMRTFGAAVVLLFAVQAQAAFVAPSGLLGWYAADNIDGQNNATLTPGGEVTNWVNLANPGTFDAQANGTGSGPTFVASSGAVNGHAVVQLNGTDDGFQIGTMDDTPGGVHLFIVSQSSETDGARYQRLFSAYDDEASNDYTGRSTYMTRPDLTGEPNPGYPQAYEWMITTGSWGADKTLENAFIGRQSRHATGAEWFDGVIAEVLIFNEQLSSSDADEVEDYLTTKYSAIVVPEPATVFAGSTMLLLARRRRR